MREEAVSPDSNRLTSVGWQRRRVKTLTSTWNGKRIATILTCGKVMSRVAGVAPSGNVFERIH